MKKVEEIKDVLSKHKAELREKYGVNQIGIFGSYIKDTQNMASDVDILVEFQKTIDILTFVHIKNYLSELLDVNVDLVMKKALKPHIGKRILKEVVYI